MFEYCINLDNLDISSFNTINLGDSSGMFKYCEKLKELKFSSKNFSTKKIKNMSKMFQGCINLQ